MYLLLKFKERNRVPICPIYSSISLSMAPSLEKTACPA
jgi:hypothetical protein